MSEEVSPNEQKAIERFYKLHELKRKAKKELLEEMKLKELGHRNIPAARILVRRVHFDVLRDLKNEFLRKLKKAQDNKEARTTFSEKEYFDGRIMSYENILFSIQELLKKEPT